jgi:hypothetical protein
MIWAPDESQLDGRRQSAGQIVHDWARREEAGAHITAQEAADISDELNGERPVVAELAAERFDLGWSGGVTRHQRYRIGGDDPGDDAAASPARLVGMNRSHVRLMSTLLRV